MLLLIARQWEYLPWSRFPRGVMILHDYGYLLPKFLTTYPVSEWNSQIYTLSRSVAFFQELFHGESIVMQIFLLFLNQLLRGEGCKSLWGGKTAWEESQESAEQCIKTQKGVVLLTCSPSLQIRSMTSLLLPNFCPGPWFQNNFCYVL